MSSTSTPATSARTLTVTAATFEQEVIEASFDRPVVVDFSAAWCPPCQLAGATLREVAAARFESAVFATVDIDADPELARRYGIHALPTLHFFRDGRVVGSLVGLHGREQILRLLDAEPPALLSA